MSLRVFLILFLTFSNVFSAKILCVFFVPSISHQMIFQPIWKELSLRGHKVTVITPNTLNDPTLTNLTEIDTSTTYNYLKNISLHKSISKDNYLFSKLLFMLNFGIITFETILRLEPVRKLINDDKIEFDLVILQNMNHYSVALGFVGKYKCISIGISSMEVYLHTHDAFGNPTHPITSPDMMLNIHSDVTFIDKVNSLLYNIWYRVFYYWYVLPVSDEIARKHFGNLPYLGDVEKNFSLLMVNVNPLIHSIRPNVPNIIEINMMHIKKKKPLPQDIKEFMDNSTRGVIYFSLGSNVKSASLSTEVKKEIISCFRELPYEVLWKYEEEDLLDIPGNVIIRKWFPQQDILGHRNVRLFITQGGLQSIEEAIFNEVPLIGIPFILDQYNNIDKIEKIGMGLRIDYENIVKDDFKAAIIEVAEHDKYRIAVREGKSIIIDQPMVGVEKAIWWIEYVLRHKGARHLRSAAAGMSFFEYFMMDVIIFLLGIVFFSLYVVNKLICSLKKNCRRFFKIKEQ
ncbi:UDP-glucosyltransferase 2-like [Diorhabda carinulata]|uniref:UDP-glucosyltransferase 2-like n=1 Tax=Diorhabda carinulata TaxID=1163345 RepID=UPI0025A1C58F|nr:UDP-glucosyltransferase 2-like [Diorhabda carinulata]